MHELLQRSIHLGVTVRVPHIGEQLLYLTCRIHDIKPRATTCRVCSRDRSEMRGEAGGEEINGRNARKETMERNRELEECRGAWGKHSEKPRSLGARDEVRRRGGEGLRC